ncbi:hypothetical protein J132_05208 [Termitomyces sp. J132]|nr:hypothetical protein J132_05208 [Termitomyces sp. J132]
MYDWQGWRKMIVWCFFFMFLPPVAFPTGFLTHPCEQFVSLLLTDNFSFLIQQKNFVWEGV